MIDELDWKKESLSMCIWEVYEEMMDVSPSRSISKIFCMNSTDMDIVVPAPKMKRLLTFEQTIVHVAETDHHSHRILLRSKLGNIVQHI